MSTLHTLSEVCPSPEALAQKLRYRSAQDPVLLLQDAVLMASQPRMVEQLNSYPLYLLTDDMVARGVTAVSGLSATEISYPEFVQLTLATTQQVTW